MNAFECQECKAVSFVETYEVAGICPFCEKKSSFRKVAPSDVVTLNLAISYQNALSILTELQRLPSFTGQVGYVYCLMPHLERALKIRNATSKPPRR